MLVLNKDIKKAIESKKKHILDYKKEFNYYTELNLNICITVSTITDTKSFVEMNFITDDKCFLGNVIKTDNGGFNRIDSTIVFIDNKEN